MHIRNPIIPGFHPDPSICRVGPDYFLGTSSFEYFPGVPLFHSRDLTHWRQIGHCLTRASQLPLDKVRASGGIFAPTIRHADGWFTMITTNVTGGGHFVVRTRDPFGPWGEPVWLPGGGINPALLFDEDGQVYFTYTANGQIVQRLLDMETGHALSAEQPIWGGTGGQYPEGPHLYKINGFYYLLISEGGTEYGHMITVARSRSPWGPFESCPVNPILSHRSLKSPIQATGHGDLLQSLDGRCWLVFLGIRPHGFPPCYHLGRETFLAPVTWSADGWPVIAAGGPVALELDLPDSASAAVIDPPATEPGLGPEWNFLRNPDPTCWSFDAPSRHLRLWGRAIGLDEVDSPAWVGRRQEQFEQGMQVEVEFAPESEREEAGLVVWMNECHHAEIFLTRRNGQRMLVSRRRIGSLAAESPAIPAPEGASRLGIEATAEEYRFTWAAPGGEAHVLSTSETRYLSTEVAGGFTGVYYALYATGGGQPCKNRADFTIEGVCDPAGRTHLIY